MRSARRQAEEQGHRDESAGRARNCAHRYGYLRSVRLGNRLRRRRVKRGNLYPEQHQIGMRRRLAPQGGSSEHAGRWLERGSNAGPRGMIAHRVRPVYRIRPTGLSRFIFFRSSRSHLLFFFQYPDASTVNRTAIRRRPLLSGLRVRKVIYCKA